MTGDPRHRPVANVGVMLLYDAAQMLSNRPGFALSRDGGWSSLSLAADIERLLNKLRMFYNAVLDALPDVTLCSYLAHRDDEQSYEVIAMRFTLPTTEVESRIANALLARSGCHVATGRIVRND